MQVTETLSQGLKREFKVVLPATELEQRLNDELTNLKGRVNIAGFRPGKVPVAHLRRVYGRSVMADVVQNAVNEANRKIVEDNSLKLAYEPQVQFPENKDEIEKVMDAKADLAFTVALEVLPVFDLVDLSGVSVKKPVAEVTDAEITESLERMAKQNRSFEPKKGKSAEGDRVAVDFVGRIDGKEFDGGKGTDVRVELGSNTFIPGFEDQLVGLKAGDTKLVKVAFPTNYLAPNLAGKDAEFDVTVKEVEAPGELKIDDEMAKGFGMESLDKLKEAISSAIQRDFDAQSRRKLKKDLLDSLDSKYSFELPPSLVEQEFAAVWSQVEADMKSSNRTFADEETTEEEARAEYRKIAERRVRLGLVLAQIGEKSDIKISDDEVTQALIERVRQYPGQEKQVWDFYRKNPQALAEIRAPLFEEKVVDQILSQVKVVDETVSKEALFGDDDGEEGSEPKAKSSKAKGTKKASKSE
ncbi:trigger factor [Microvirga terricola]|uniref:Trigger factor n=1 Tax=Microvirga terricola TaxID=2719797 RepID=A0ABX0VC46_9HYPH|nr:trigger factor [Microvirga terricola]NIX77423.1 trigger factor [Microvirga terricola]